MTSKVPSLVSSTLRSTCDRKKTIEGKRKKNIGLQAVIFKNEKKFFKYSFCIDMIFALMIWASVKSMSKTGMNLQ
jgi:hypothetical protein